MKTASALPHGPMPAERQRPGDRRFARRRQPRAVHASRVGTDQPQQRHVDEAIDEAFVVDLEARPRDEDEPRHRRSQRLPPPRPARGCGWNGPARGICSFRRGADEDGLASRCTTAQSFPSPPIDARARHRVRQDGCRMTSPAASTASRPPRSGNDWPHDQPCGMAPERLPGTPRSTTWAGHVPVARRRGGGRAGGRHVRPLVHIDPSHAHDPPNIPVRSVRVRRSARPLPRHTHFSEEEPADRDVCASPRRRLCRVRHRDVVGIPRIRPHSCPPPAAVNRPAPRLERPRLPGRVPARPGGRPEAHAVARPDATP